MQEYIHYGIVNYNMKCNRCGHLYHKRDRQNARTPRMCPICHSTDIEPYLKKPIINKPNFILDIDPMKGA